MNKDKWSHGHELNSDSFPLISTLTKQGRSLRVVNILEKTLDASTSESLDLFFSAKTLKQALKTEYNCHSAQFTELAKEVLFGVEMEEFKLDYFLSLNTLSELFLEEDTKSLQEFMQLIKCPKLRVLFILLYSKKPQIKELLKGFTSSQKLIIFTNSAGYRQVGDMLDMFIRHPEYLSEMLRRLPFGEINSFGKIHDLFASQNSKLAVKNFDIKQELHSPGILEVTGLVVEELEFVVPETYYDLIEWGEKLGHCIGGVNYANRAKNGLCLLLGLVDKESREIKYTMEIINKRVNQIQGYSGTRPSKEKVEKIMEELERVNLVA